MTGGILIVIGASSIGALWMFIFQPTMSDNMIIANIYALLRILDGLGIYMVNWTDVILGLTVEQLFWVLIFITTVPVTQVNIFNMAIVDLNSLLFGLTFILTLGAILVFYSVRED